MISPSVFLTLLKANVVFDSDWGSWGPWGACLPECRNSASQTRTRRCIKPRFGGRHCDEAEREDSRPCDQREYVSKACPSDHPYAFGRGYNCCSESKDGKGGRLGFCSVNCGGSQLPCPVEKCS